MDPEPAAAAAAAAMFVSCSGKHCLHAYVPATEPYQLWKGLDRRSEEYKRLKEERSQVRTHIKTLNLQSQTVPRLVSVRLQKQYHIANMCVAYQCEG